MSCVTLEACLSSYLTTSMVFSCWNLMHVYSRLFVSVSLKQTFCETVLFTMVSVLCWVFLGCISLLMTVTRVSMHCRLHHAQHRIWSFESGCSSTAWFATVWGPFPECLVCQCQWGCGASPSRRWEREWSREVTEWWQHLYHNSKDMLEMNT